MYSKQLADLILAYCSSSFNPGVLYPKSPCLFVTGLKMALLFCGMLIKHLFIGNVTLDDDLKENKISKKFEIYENLGAEVSMKHEHSTITNLSLIILIENKI